MEHLLDIAASFGAPGIIVLAAGWYVVQHDKACNDAQKEMQDRHSEERKEMVAVLERQHTEALATQNETNDVLRGTTGALAELSSLIRDRK